jgi:8-hydroxy-5-deazaflavin:NADPH oxidoreductase
MKIGVLGTGMVGVTISNKLLEKSHSVKMGSRTSENEKAIEWLLGAEKNASAGTFEDAAKFGELLIVCTKGENTVEALQQAGTENLKGKIILDVSNPLDFSQGSPAFLIPTLSNTNSVGEEVQKAFPDAKIVKTLNTMWCGIMVNPASLGAGEHNVFMSGNDAEAKLMAKKFLNVNFDWKPDNIIDLGDITTSRGTEAFLPLWLRIWGAIGTGAFNIKIVK